MRKGLVALLGALAIGPVFANQANTPQGMDYFNRVFNISESGAEVAAGDFDGDGYLDFVSGSSLPDNYVMLTLHKNDGKGNFTKRIAYLGKTSTPPRPEAAIVSGDFDGDGDLDLVARNSYDEIGFFENDGKGNFILREYPKLR